VALDIIQWPSKNFGYPRGTSGRNGQQPIAICDHIMQGHMTGYYAILANPEGNAANYSVDRQGIIRQHVMDWDAAWCNGPMHSPDLTVPWIADCFEHHINPNLKTISIEHEGMSGVFLTEPQILATIALHRHLIAAHGIPRDRHGIIGHYQIDSVNKKHCPGDAFPWARLMRAIGH
jgi:N-acetyl-anhydromuramyl-L-alanine amidase AmpD